MLLELDELDFSNPHRSRSGALFSSQTQSPHESAGLARVANGGRDTVACGVGVDLVEVDATDTYSDDCEAVAQREDSRDLELDTLIGRRLFGAADPPLAVEEATFRGGMVLSDAADFPADQSTILWHGVRVRRVPVRHHCVL